MDGGTGGKTRGGREEGRRGGGDGSKYLRELQIVGSMNAQPNEESN